MGQTRTEKDLQRALEALEEIANPERTFHTAQYAAKVYAELTAPKTEQVEVKRWEQRDKDGRTRFLSMTPIQLQAHEKKAGHYVIELTGHDIRPVKEESWEGKISRVDGHHFGVYLDEPDDEQLMGRRVKVEPIIEEGE